MNTAPTVRFSRQDFDAAFQALADAAPPAPGARRLLIVDDEVAVRRALARFLRSRGLEVETVASAEDALSALAAGRFDATLCDVRMPGMGGVAFVPRALGLDPDIAVVMLTGDGDAMTATQTLTGGACDYLTKPIDPEELAAAVQRALVRRDEAAERRRMEQRIRAEVAERTAELEREKSMLREMSVDIVETLVNAMEAKDVYLRGSSLRVAELAAAVAEEMGLDAQTVEHVRVAGSLKEIGRIGVREAVLNKPGTLSDAEVEHIRNHVRLSVEILAPLRHLGSALRFVQDHHEHWDGGGYPHGLRGEAISIGGRILAAADAYEAITSRRPYREALAAARALEFLESLVGSLLDPRVYLALRAVVERRSE